MNIYEQVTASWTDKIKGSSVEQLSLSHQLVTDMARKADSLA